MRLDGEEALVALAARRGDAPGLPRAGALPALELRNEERAARARARGRARLHEPSRRPDLRRQARLARRGPAAGLGAPARCRSARRATGRPRALRAGDQEEAYRRVAPKLAQSLRAERGVPELALRRLAARVPHSSPRRNGYAVVGRASVSAGSSAAFVADLVAPTPARRSAPPALRTCGARRASPARAAAPAPRRVRSVRLRADADDDPADRHAARRRRFP